MLQILLHLRQKKPHSKYQTHQKNPKQQRLTSLDWKVSKRFTFLSIKVLSDNCLRTRNTISSFPRFQDYGDWSKVTAKPNIAIWVYHRGLLEAWLDALWYHKSTKTMLLETVNNWQKHTLYKSQRHHLNQFLKFPLEKTKNTLKFLEKYIFL